MAICGLAGAVTVALAVEARVPRLAPVVLAYWAAALLGARWGPVPLLVGSAIPRHYCLALSATGDAWHVYEPTSGEVRVVPLDHVRRSTLAVLLGFDRLSAVLLPS